MFCAAGLGGAWFDRGKSPGLVKERGLVYQGEALASGVGGLVWGA